MLLAHDVWEKEWLPVPSCAKPPTNRKVGEPLTSTREALIRLSQEVAEKRRKRATLPALPSAIERVMAERVTASRVTTDKPCATEK